MILLKTVIRLKTSTTLDLSNKSLFIDHSNKLFRNTTIQLVANELQSNTVELTYYLSKLFIFV